MRHHLSRFFRRTRWRLQTPDSDSNSNCDSRTELDQKQLAQWPQKHQQPPNEHSAQIVSNRMEWKRASWANIERLSMDAIAIWETREQTGIRYKSNCSLQASRQMRGQKRWQDGPDAIWMCFGLISIWRKENRLNEAYGKHFSNWQMDEVESENCYCNEFPI